MKITKIGQPQIVMSNPSSRHNYFGWPTAIRLQNGKIAVVASGNRMSHICPFGKTVISYSENEAESYTSPAPVIDTTLDDRDGGICTFGENGVIVTSFNNTRAFQKHCLSLFECIPDKAKNAYAAAYLETVSDNDEQRDLGATFKISNDGGITFGELLKSPITSPHGPCELSDGTILWVGTLYDDNALKDGENTIKVYTIDPENGNMTYVSEIENITLDDGYIPYSCEPYAMQAADGTIIAQIRVQHKDDRKSGIFTIYQSESSDNGKSWTKPHAVLDDLMGGSPPHILKASDGTLIGTYGFRKCDPFGVKAMISTDNGKSWDTDHYLYENHITSDLGYPSTVELSDGSFLTVFYACPEKSTTSSPATAVILQQKWKLDK